ncbi:MAG: glutamate-5-semialdehyde dehydrogenase [Muribaculaceae bacterium]
MTDNQDITAMLSRAREASRSLLSLTDSETADTLRAVADAIESDIPAVLEANARDLARMSPADPKYDRLKLTADRLHGIAADTRNVASLPSPLIQLEERTLPNGLRLRKVAVPFGVIGVIFEARPNVSVDVFSLCFRSGNACVLKGGHDAADSNAALTGIIRRVLAARGIDPDVCTLLPSTHAATDALLRARGLVDLIIPRGGRRLIDAVRAGAEVPVIETGAGVCHCYVDADADVAMATAIINNAKTRRVSVCNALDCALVHASLLGRLPEICAPLGASKVVIHADERALMALDGHYPAELLCPAQAEDFGTEFLSYQMALRTVDTLDEALEHIRRYGSGHSESCVTANAAAADRFRREVDAACVYINAPTSFTDGAQFGLGAEIGISTQKLHARGPMALRELTTYKWLIDGNGQLRPA